MVLIQMPGVTNHLMLLRPDGDASLELHPEQLLADELQLGQFFDLLMCQLPVDHCLDLCLACCHVSLNQLKKEVDLCLL